MAAPSPAVIAPQPATIEIRAPGWLCGKVGPPSVAVAVNLQPATVRCQRFVKGRIIGGRLKPRLVYRWRPHGHRWSASWRPVHRCRYGSGLLARRFRLGLKAPVFSLKRLQAGLQFGILLFAIAQGGDFRLQLRAARLQIGGGLLQFGPGTVPRAGNIAAGQQEQKQGGGRGVKRFHGGNEVPSSLTLPQDFHSHDPGRPSTKPVIGGVDIARANGIMAFVSWPP